MFSEISLHILDIVQNSISARASSVEITVSIDNASDTLTVIIEDNGFGMTDEELSKAVDRSILQEQREKTDSEYLFSKPHLK